MRVISGSARGRMLDAVPGKNTRPTTDKVKESVFNILQFRLYDAAMLDLFAGTGQMGIEALSRGAAECVFIDDSAANAESARRVGLDAIVFFGDAVRLRGELRARGVNVGE